MICSNCRQNEATMKFLQIINGEKTELFLCENCAEDMGIENIDISIPIDFSSFISDFFETYNQQELLSTLTDTKIEKCKNCGLSYNEFVKTGKLGCVDCYNVFKDRIDLITKNIQGSSEHKGKCLPNNNFVTYNNVENDNKKEGNMSNQNVKEEIDYNEQIEILKLKLKKAVKEEKYEEAANIRDEIKKLEKSR